MTQFPEGVDYLINEEEYVITLRLTPSEYRKLKNDADWESGGRISAHLKDLIVGRVRRGC